MQAGITHNRLFGVLDSLPPMEILAVALRRRQAGGETLERQELDAATRQLIDYTTACGKLGEQLVSLTAVPASDESLIAGYPL